MRSLANVTVGDALLTYGVRGWTGNAGVCGREAPLATALPGLTLLSVHDDAESLCGCVREIGTIITIARPAGTGQRDRLAARPPRRPTRYQFKRGVLDEARTSQRG